MHVDAPADSLHRTVTEEEIKAWLKAVGLSIVRDCRLQRGHGGPDEYMAVATT